MIETVCHVVMNGFFVLREKDNNALDNTCMIVYNYTND